MHQKLSLCQETAHDSVQGPACCTTLRMRQSQMEHSVAPACESKKPTQRASAPLRGAPP